MDLPGIDITKLKPKCGSIIAVVIRLQNGHSATIPHECSGDLDHIEEHCVCKCGFYWQSIKKDSIGG